MKKLNVIMLAVVIFSLFPASKGFDAQAVTRRLGTDLTVDDCNGYGAAERLIDDGLLSNLYVSKGHFKSRSLSNMKNTSSVRYETIYQLEDPSLPGYAEVEVDLEDGSFAVFKLNVKSISGTGGGSVRIYYQTSSNKFQFIKTDDTRLELSVIFEDASRNPIGQRTLAITQTSNTYINDSGAYVKLNTTGGSHRTSVCVDINGERYWTDASTSGVGNTMYKSTAQTLMVPDATQFPSITLYDYILEDAVNVAKVTYNAISTSDSVVIDLPVPATRKKSSVVTGSTIEYNTEIKNTTEEVIEDYIVIDRLDSYHDASSLKVESLTSNINDELNDEDYDIYVNEKYGFFIVKLSELAPNEVVDIEFKAEVES